MPRFHEQTVRALLCAGLWIGLTFGDRLAAQGPAASLQGGPAIARATDITFDLLCNAPLTVPFRATQVRRFLQPDGSIVGVLEDVVADGGGANVRFRLDFLGLEGVNPDPVARTRWSNTYVQSAALLHEHGGFRIRDLAAARRNYTLRSFGRSLRAGRPVWWSVVAPTVRDKASWVLALDEMTGLPVYQAQVDSQNRLLAEVDVTQLSTGVPAGTSWWTPAMTVTRHATAEAAITSMQSANARQPLKALVVPELGPVMPEYSLHMSQVTQVPLTGECALVLGYTDGIDEFFVVQSSGQADPFAGLPVRNAKTRGALPSDHEMTIARYDDASLRVYLFHREDILFRIAGNGALVRLDDVARRLAQQVVTGV